jgi:prepilin peptidase CpaA
MELQLLSTCLLCGLLLAAGVRDLRTRRIPTALVLFGMGLGLSRQALAPTALFAGDGSGLQAGLLGGLAGLALFLPLYLLRALGAGDVKLLAMVGVWLGPQGVLHATLWTLLAGGALALVLALANGTLRQAGMNMLRIARAAVLRSCSAGMLVQAPVATTGRLPYALAIATGAAVEMVRGGLY